MRFLFLLRFLVASGLGLSTGWATSDHLLSVFQVLDVQGPTDPVIGSVTYVTWYGAAQETTLAAMVWPSTVGSPHDNVEKRDRNWASVLGLKSSLMGQEEGWKLTIDLSGFKPLGDIAEDDEYREQIHVELVEKFFEAATMNLLQVGVFDCELSVLGEDALPLLKGLKIPKVLNPVDDVWGPWKYNELRKRYPDGDLQELAARSLSHEGSLDTLFLILSSEEQSEKGKLALTPFLQEVLARVGDDKFSKALGGAESLVQARIGKALGPVTEAALKFPKTAALVK